MEYIKFKDATISTQYGYTATETSQTEGKYKYLRITDIVPYYVNFETVPFCEIPEKQVQKYLVKEGDILIARTGATTGYNYVVPKAICNTVYASYLIRFVIDRTLVRPLFMKYVLKSQSYYGFVNNYIGGSAQPGMNAKVFGKFNIPRHSIECQDKIASILSTYDTLIENNTKRIRLLEQMAENLYKEWFAFHRIKDKSRVVKLQEIINISRGLSYSSEEIDCTEGNNLINLKNIQGYGGFRQDGTKKYNGKYKTEQIVNEGDLIMGVTDMTQDRRTVGSVALIPNIDRLSVISADLIKINSNIDNVYLYSMFRYGNVSKYIAQFANGANVLHLKPQAVLNIRVNLPEQGLVDSYVSKVKPMIKLINRLNSEIRYLTRQRDLLLPRLMSGKLEVKF